MRKVSILLVAILVSFTAFAQTAPTKAKTVKEKAADHFMVQLASNYWSGTDAEVSKYIKGFSRSLNVYAMYDKQFKSNPKFSIAAGIGVGNSNIYFNKMEVRITANKPILPFVRTDTGNNFKKYKLATTYLEIPLEFRFTSNRDNPNKAVKVAIGGKIGTLINAHTKGKTLRNAAGTAINSYTEKENSKSYFNGTRLSLTGRVGYGLFSLFGSYSITNVFKDGVAPDIKLIQVGIAFSGL